MRLTNDLRHNILVAATKSVPTIDYHAKLAEVVQDVLFQNMPPAVQETYADIITRPYLSTSNVTIKDGNGNGASMTIAQKKHGCAFCNAPTKFFGTFGEHTLYVQINPAAVATLKQGTLSYKLSNAVIKSGFYQAHMEQNDLLAQVKNRLKATLAACTTIKRLYEVLEPELHYLIPAEDNKVANLPATAGPVVADLRRLGAQFPDAPKAKQPA